MLNNFFNPDLDFLASFSASLMNFLKSSLFSTLLTALVTNFLGDVFLLVPLGVDVELPARDGELSLSSIGRDALSDETVSLSPVVVLPTPLGSSVFLVSSFDKVDLVLSLGLLWLLLFDFSEEVTGVGPE